MIRGLCGILQMTFAVNDRAAVRACIGIYMRKMIMSPSWQFPRPSPSQYIVNPDNSIPREFNTCNTMFDSSKPVGRGMLVMMIYVLNRDTVIEWLHLTPTMLSLNKERKMEIKTRERPNVFHFHMFFLGNKKRGGCSDCDSESQWRSKV